MKKSALAACAAAAALLSQGVQAQPFGSFDPVSMAMGGVGVGLPSPMTANLYNPAHLSGYAAERDEDFALGFAAGARAYDEDSVLDVLSDVQDDFDEIDRLVSAVEADPGSADQGDLDALAAAARRLDRNLTEAHLKAAQVELGGNLLANGSVGSWGVGLMVNAHAAIGARVKYSDEDSQTLQDLADAAENPTGPISYDESTLTSEAQIVGAAIGEVGLTLAKRFAVGNGSLSVGVTPKLMQIETINYSTSIEDTDTDDLDADDYRASYEDVNVDVGLLADFGNGFYAGLTVKNLIGQEYDTLPAPVGSEVYTIKLEPQARLGVGYDGGWFRLGVDADLTENDPVAFENGTQFVAVGAELDAFGWAQLRAGYRHNTVDADRSVASVGLGLSPFKVLHVDLAVAASDKEVGAGLQLALTF